MRVIVAALAASLAGGASAAITISTVYEYVTYCTSTSKESTFPLTSLFPMSSMASKPSASASALASTQTYFDTACQCIKTKTLGPILAQTSTYYDHECKCIKTKTHEVVVPSKPTAPPQPIETKTTTYYDKECDCIKTKTLKETLPPGPTGPPEVNTVPLTTYTTIYSCPGSTGMEEKTYTITEPCPTPGKPRGSDHIPEHFVVTTATCTACPGSPIVTVTQPETTTPPPGGENSLLPSPGKVGAPGSSNSVPASSSGAPAVPTLPISIISSIPPSLSEAGPPFSGETVPTLAPSPGGTPILSNLPSLESGSPSEGQNVPNVSCPGAPECPSAAGPTSGIQSPASATPPVPGMPIGSKAPFPIPESAGSNPGQSGAAAPSQAQVTSSITPLTGNAPSTCVSGRLATIMLALSVGLYFAM